MALHPRLPRLRMRRLVALTPIALVACGGGNPYQGMTADDLFNMAVIEMEEGDYDHTIRALERLVLTYGDWPRVPEARLMLGDAHFAKGEYLTARTQYQRFIDRNAGHASAPEAALGICRSLAELSPIPQRDQGYTEEAITSCRNVVVDYTGLPQAREAADISNRLRGTLAAKEYDTGAFYFRRKLFDSAIIYYERVAQLYAETEWAPWALLGVLRSNQEIGYDDLADDARERLLTRYPDSAAAAEARGDEAGH